MKQNEKFEKIPLVEKDTWKADKNVEKNPGTEEIEEQIEGKTEEVNVENINKNKENEEEEEENEEKDEAELEELEKEMLNAEKEFEKEEKQRKEKKEKEKENQRKIKEQVWQGFTKENKGSGLLHSAFKNK